MSPGPMQSEKPLEKQSLSNFSILIKASKKETSYKMVVTEKQTVDDEAIAYCLRDGLGTDAYLPYHHEVQFSLWVAEYPKSRKGDRSSMQFICPDGQTMARSIGKGRSFRRSTLISNRLHLCYSLGPLSVNCYKLLFSTVPIHMIGHINLWVLCKTFFAAWTCCGPKTLKGSRCSQPSPFCASN